MASQPNVFNTLINPIQVQTYERYLPTAFDEGMTLLEKVNKIILQLNRIGKLSNDVLDQWNQVMDWVMADGLDASIDAKIDSMLQDGSLATIIGNAITNLGSEIGDLTTLDTTAKDTLVNAINELFNSIATNKTTLEAEIASNKTTLEGEIQNAKYYGTPEDYGAKGDGVTDDTSAIQACLNACEVTAFKPTSYLISGTLTLPKNHSIQGNHAELKVGSVFTPNSLGASVPTYTILYMATRGQVYQEELNNYTQFVKDLRIRGNSNFANQTGMYLGVTDQNSVSQSTSVNYSVTGANIENISISICKDGLVIGEVWQSTFKNVQTSYITNNACAIVGQSVNNTFLGCFFATSQQGQNGLYVTHGVYSGNNRRPEGNMFIGGYIGSSQIGIRINDAFVFKFTSVIIDITSTSAVVHDTNGFAEDIIYDSCYFMSTGSVVFNVGDSSNAGFVSIRGCNFIPNGSTNAILIGQNQVCVVNGCEITALVGFASSAKGSVINNIWNAVSTANAQINKNGSTIYVNNNVFKLDGASVVAS